mgnify:FL=1
MRLPVVPRVLVVAIGFAACGGGQDAPSFVARDSAGVTIAESQSPAWADDAGWRVGEALVRIGVVDGDSRYQFSDVAGTVRLSDGTIVVADGGSQQLRFFMPDGRWQASFGGPGGGPGEFTGLSSLGRTPDDQVWAYDFSLRRLTWTDASGRLLRLVPLDPEPPSLSPLGPLSDGTFAMKQLWGSKTGKDEPEIGLLREPTAYVRFDSLGTLVDTLGTFPGRELFITLEKGRGVMSSPLFGRTSAGVVQGHTLIIGDQEEFRFGRYDPDGTMLTEVRLGRPAALIGPNDVSEHIEFLVESSPPDKQAWLEQSLTSMPTPETRPAYGSFLVDRDDFLWVSEWSQFPGIPRTWTVVDTSDRWLGDVVMPPGFIPRDIGSDWILGIETDALGVEFVVQYSLVKPPDVRR